MISIRVHCLNYKELIRFKLTYFFLRQLEQKLQPAFRLKTKFLVFIKNKDFLTDAIFLIVRNID